MAATRQTGRGRTGMRSLYFAQYLVNEGLVKPQEMKELLRACGGTKPGMAVLALAEGAVSAARLAGLAPFAAEDFPSLAMREGILFPSQIEKLGKLLPTNGHRLAQALLDSGRMDFVELGRCMARCGAFEGSPVKDAVRRLAADDSFEAERAVYADFTELFMRFFARFMDTPAVVNFCEPDIAADEGTRVVSQRLMGAVSFVSGVYAETPVFMEMAQRYGHELISEPDGLAEDCVVEFLNVVNGLFIVDLGKHDMDVDLDVPRIGVNQEPMGSGQLLLPIDTGFGSFALVLAQTEITLRQSSL